MALSLILRNTAKLQALPKASKCVMFTNNVRPFSQILTPLNKSPISASKSKINTVVIRSMSGDHSKLWPIEKAVSIALLGLVPATFLTPNIVLDNLLAVAVVAHFHWGLEACVIDYVRPIIFGPVIPKIVLGLLYVISAATLGGLLYYNHNCIGIGKTGRRFWEIKC
ncbi:succinate dehydrogenase [ubiquinone] cytochrome b small subunit, mitochondrial [Anoplophora glabripennis]|uniref:succinate dehydrogenase [ubiquinone] cytochrome b small subunit, mitochondrial n=1 Tax=Anoplophora glabripennis TaxID=217634 RepID=UPI000874B423|nr:succinate dehydrogenase [ubiquinone] cytochrome b small subunit, mitochondrial [Anoplophora glabripennis]